MAEKLRADVVAGTEDPLTPDDWREAWELGARGLFRSIDGRERLLELADRRRATDEE